MERLVRQPLKRSGLDRLAAGEEPPIALRGKRVALLCNHTAVTRDGRHAAEVLAAESVGTQVVRLLGPEHGVWSTHQDMEPVLDGPPRDPYLGLPVVSLYGDDLASLSAGPESLADVDVVVYDVRDIGARYYTYAATLAFLLEGATARGVDVLVLDRTNPIGDAVEGPLLEPGFESFCGIEPGLPVRHGMTVGALGRWYRDRRAPDASLYVMECDDGATGGEEAVWVPPSPNMPTLEAAVVYPGMCLLEGTTLSEGRGTTQPFLLFGAPNIDPIRLAAELNRREIPGVTFVPRVFRPEFQKHAKKTCSGAYMVVHDRDAVEAVALGVHVLDAVARVAPEALGWRVDAYEFVEDVPAIDLLWGSDQLRRTIDAGGDIAPLLTRITADAEAFQRG